MEQNNLSFRRQWYIGKDKPPVSFCWNIIQLTGEYKIYAHQDLDVKFLSEEDTIVVQFGIAVNPYNIADNHIDRLLSLIANTSLFEQYIEELGGSYVILTAVYEKINIYNDPSGMMGVYYSGNAAASTPSLLSGEIDQDLKFEFTEGNDWYTGEFTRYFGTKKLFPNHCLTLPSQNIRRFWPLKNIQRSSGKFAISDLIHSTSEMLRGMVAGTTLSHKPLCSITGGQDSRVVLAASLPVKDKISYFTLQGEGVKSCDIKYAGLLARECKIAHNFVDIIKTPEWLYNYYDDISAGESIGARRTISGTCFGLSSGSETLHINGNLGAICKSFYWHNKTPNAFKTTEILKHFKEPSAIIKRGIQDWLNTTPELPPDQLYNLFYLEQRGGRWISAGENCSRLFYESFAPFNHRKIFETVCSFPLSIQYGGKILKMLVEHMEPELANVPYCPAHRNWSKYVPESIKQKLRRFL